MRELISVDEACGKIVEKIIIADDVVCVLFTDGTAVAKTCDAGHNNVSFDEITNPLLSSAIMELVTEEERKQYWRSKVRSEAAIRGHAAKRKRRQQYKKLKKEFNKS